MRITQTIMLNMALQSEATTSTQVANLTEEASSGVRVMDPSDDPAAFATIQEQDAQIGTVTARNTAASQAGGDLNLAAGVLGQAHDLLSKAASLANEALNATQNAQDRTDIATQLQGLQQEMLSLANTQGATGNYLFGGTANNQQPFVSNGTTVDFQGNDGVSHVEISNGVQVPTNASGADAFTAAGGGIDVFAAMQDLQTALSTNDVSGIQSSVGAMNAAATQISTAQVDAGLSSDRLTSATTVMTNALTQLQSQKSNTADADAPTTLSNLEEAQTAYEAAMEVNKQVLSLASASVNG